MVQRRDHAVEIQVHVLVDQHVPEPWQGHELPDQGWRDPGDLRESSDSVRVVFEAQAVPRGELAGDIDDELADGQKRVEDIVVKRQVAAQRLCVRDPGADPSQVVQVPAELGQPFHELAHRLSASSLIRLIRSSQGARSAAWSWTSRVYVRSA